MSRRSSGRQNARTRGDNSAPAEIRWVELPIVGKVPMIRSDSGWWAWDLDFEPTLPLGALRGNPRRQQFCCDVPRYAYIDESRDCIQCGEGFIFSAKEQQFWFETLKFHLSSKAIRCGACRKRRRTDVAIQRRYELAKAAANQDDPRSLIEYVAALYELFERTGAGRLDDGIAAARKVRRIEPGWADPLFWEAEGQRLAGRLASEIGLLAEFLARTPQEQFSQVLRTRANTRLRVLNVLPTDREE